MIGVDGFAARMIDGGIDPGAGLVGADRLGHDGGAARGEEWENGRNPPQSFDPLPGGAPTRRRRKAMTAAGASKS